MDPAETTVAFVAPAKPRRPRHHGMTCPYDFFYALFNIWDCAQLAHVMQLLSWAIELVPTEHCDISYWAQYQHGVTPILTPALSFVPPSEAFARLAEAGRRGDLSEPQEAALVASMRLTTMVGFIGDHRVRTAIMAKESGIHEHIQARPPDPYYVWHFFAREARGAAIAHFEAMATYEQRLRKAREAASKPPVLGLGCIRSSDGLTEEEGEEEALRLTQRWLEEFKHLLFVPL
jgi:hypothetical protein